MASHAFSTSVCTQLKELPSVFSWPTRRSIALPSRLILSTCGWCFAFNPWTPTPPNRPSGLSPSLNPPYFANFESFPSPMPSHFLVSSSSPSTPFTPFPVSSSISYSLKGPFLSTLPLAAFFSSASSWVDFLLSLSVLFSSPSAPSSPLPDALCLEDAPASYLSKLTSRTSHVSPLHGRLHEHLHSHTGLRSPSFLHEPHVFASTTLLWTPSPIIDTAATEKAKFEFSGRPSTSKEVAALLVCLRYEREVAASVYSTT